MGKVSFYHQGTKALRFHFVFAQIIETFCVFMFCCLCGINVFSYSILDISLST